MACLTLNIVTPDGALPPLFCESVYITVGDDKDEKKGGGYGIRTGHTKTLFSVATGPLRAYNGDKILLDKISGEGFATVENDVVTLILDNVR